MNGFSLDFVSPASYRNLAVEISFDRQLLCELRNERDDGQLEVSFFHDQRILQNGVQMMFDVQTFLAVFTQACDELRQATESAREALNKI